MRVRAGVVALGVASAALLAGSGLGASAAFAAPRHAPKNAVVFRAQHIAGLKGQVLLAGPGLVVYTFSSDKRGKPGTCTGECAAVWPPVRGVPEVAHGTKLPGKFGRIDGQVTYNGWPLYLFTGEKSHHNHADSSFKVVRPSAPPKKPSPSPSPTPTVYW
jgi:predicted lipoprotein with Yx(FWY)xxD motif